MKGILLSILLTCLLQLSSVPASDLPKVTHYALDVRFDLKEQRVSIVASVSVKNTTESTHTGLPFLLYRLLTVGQVGDTAGSPLTFSQQVGQLRDEPSLQAREVTVQLHRPLRPGDSVTVVLTYEGRIYGYPEVMAYVRDRIDEHYSLLRPDAFAYPMLADPTFASVHAAYDTKFTYTVQAVVPKEYRVACGGTLVASRSDSSHSTFLFQGTIPTWRIDVAVARFAVVEKADDHLVVYHLPEDSTGARQILSASKRAIKFYSDLFGRSDLFTGYTIIEIPDGWGSQAGDAYFLQTAAAFRDTSRISEVYHEIGHSWNATGSQEVKRCRYFDEAFASFFESLAMRAFSGERVFVEDMEKSRDAFARWAQHDRQVFETPIAGYGAKELGRHSYTKGAWSLYVLYELVGEKAFALIIRTMLEEFRGREITFHEFRKLCERTTNRDLDRFFREWIFGTESSGLLVEKIPIADIVGRY